MRKAFSFFITVLLIMGLASPALASSRVHWEWRDTLTTVHPGFSTSLDNGNLLVVKNGYSNAKVIELNKDKQVVWEYGPIQANSAVRLENGNTLITDSGAPGYPFKPQVIEVSPAGKVVWNYELKSRADAPRYAERLSNGNTLIVTPWEVMELAPNKSKVWSYSKGLINPVKATRLSGGNTLIVDKGFKGGKVLEVDQTGKTVWEYGNYTRGVNRGQLTAPTDAIRLNDGSTIIIDQGNARIVYLNSQKEIINLTSWEDVMDALPIMNLWGVNLASDQEIYLSVSYTNGRPALLQIDDKSFKTYLNGKYLFTAVLPTVTNGVTMVPAKDFLTAFGAGISWDSEAKKMTAEKSGLKLELMVGTKEAVLNGQKVQLPAAPKIVSNTLMIPLRTATETFGVGLKWDGVNKVIQLTVD